MTCELKLVMVDGNGRDERGEDLKGIYRDDLSSFWQVSMDVFLWDDPDLDQ